VLKGFLLEHNYKVMQFL